MSRLFSLILLLAVLALFLNLVTCRDDHFAWHQKITVSVETPAGVVSGAAVQSLSVTKTL